MVVIEWFSVRAGVEGITTESAVTKGTTAEPFTFTFVQLVLLHDVILNWRHFLFLLTRRLPVFLAGVPAAIVHVVAEVCLDELRSGIGSRLP